MRDKAKDSRDKFRIANKFQKKILALVFFSALVPMLIAGICLYYLIFHMVAAEMGFPEAIGYTLIPAAQRVTTVLIIGFLFSAVLIWVWALRVSYKLVGPLERLCREIDLRITGKEKGYIYFRKGDYLAVVAGRINSLLEKLK